MTGEDDDEPDLAEQVLDALECVGLARIPIPPPPRRDGRIKMIQDFSWVKTSSRYRAERERLRRK